MPSHIGPFYQLKEILGTLHVKENDVVNWTKATTRSVCSGPSPHNFVYKIAQSVRTENAVAHHSTFR
jgi:hypothetical protein